MLTAATLYFRSNTIICSAVPELLDVSVFPSVEDLVTVSRRRIRPVPPGSCEFEN